jgi:hypothetical protein
MVRKLALALLLTAQFAMVANVASAYVPAPGCSPDNCIIKTSSSYVPAPGCSPDNCIIETASSYVPAPGCSPDNCIR